MLKLTFPRTHKREEIRPYYRDFKGEYPNLFARWKAYVKRFPNENFSDEEAADFERTLNEVAEKSAKFFSERTDYENASALVIAAADLTQLLHDEINTDSGYGDEKC